MPARPKQISADHFIQAGTLKPPAALPPAAKALWTAVMESTPRDHWRPADSPLLSTYCRVAALAAEAVAHLEQAQVDANGRPSVWVGVLSAHAKTLAALAGKLRLCPSARTRPEAHSLQTRPAHKPWQWGDTDRDSLLAR